MEIKPRLRDIVLIPVGFWVILLILRFTGVISSEITTLGTAAILALIMAVRILPSQTMRVIAGILIFATIASIAWPWLLSYYTPYTKEGMEERRELTDLLKGEQIGGEVTSLAVLRENCRKKEGEVLHAKQLADLKEVEAKQLVEAEELNEFNAKQLVELKKFDKKQLVDLEEFKKKKSINLEEFNAKQLVEHKEFKKKQLVELKEFNAKQLVDLEELKEFVKSFNPIQEMRQICSEYLKEKANLSLSGSKEGNQTFHAIIWKTIGFAMLWLFLFGGFMRTGALKNMNREGKITCILISLVVAATLSAWLIFDEGALVAYTFLKTEIIAKNGRELFWGIGGIIGLAVIIKDWGDKSIGVILIKIALLFALMIVVDQLIWAETTTGLLREIQKALPWLKNQG